MKGLKVLLLVLSITLMITCGGYVITGISKGEEKSSPELKVIPMEEVEPEPVVEESPIVETVETVPEVVVIPVVVELPETAIVEKVEIVIPKDLKIEEIEKVEIVVEKITNTIEVVETVEVNEPKEVVEEIPVETAQIVVSYEEEDITMSCPPEQSTNALVGFYAVVGAFNDTEDGGTILYTIPVIRLDVYQTDGLGFGGYGYYGFSLTETNSFVMGNLTGISYGKTFNDFTLTTVGGIYSTHMQYSRDDRMNGLSSIGLGVDARCIIPVNNYSKELSIALGVTTGFIGDPNGTITLGINLR